MTAGTTERSAPPPTRTLVILFVASAVFTLGDGSMQLLLAPHLEAQGVATPVIGPIVAAYSIAALCFRFVTGAVYRAHRIRYLVPAGCLIQAASFVGLAVSTSELEFALFTACNGMGFAIASTGGLAAVMELRPSSSAGSIMGWYTGCMGAGYAAAGFVGGVAGDTFGLQAAIGLVAVFPVLAAAGLAAALWRVRGSDEEGGGHEAPATARRLGPLASLFGVGPLVWLAFFCALHINLLSGVLHTFFPLYGLAIGLTLTQIGALAGASSGVSSILRFASPALFTRIHYRSVLPWMVGLGGLATAALSTSGLYAVLLASWLGIGASRALLRVSSAALVMDTSGASGRQRGAASGVYMSGLDIGKILGPVLGGIGVGSVGYETTFLIAGLGIPLVFFAFYAWLKLDPTRFRPA